MLIAGISFGQDDAVMKFEGKIKDENGRPLSGASVSIMQNGKEVYSGTTDANGGFKSYEGYYGYLYKVVVTKANHTKNTIEVDSRNYDDDLLAAEVEVLIETEVYEKKEGVDYGTVENQPVDKFFMDKNSGNITHNETFNDNRTKQIEEYFKKLEGNEKDKEKKFKALVKSGDAALAEKDYKKTVEDWTAALKLKDDEALAIKLTDAEIKYEDELAEKEKEDKMRRLIKEGDEMVALLKFENAKEKYEAAQYTQPSSKLPKEKLKALQETIDIQANAIVDKEFKELMAKAAIKTSSESFDEAKTLYNKAKELKPKDKEPAKKIKEIDDIIKNLAKNKATYDKLISEAEGFLTAKNYEQSKTKFKEASDLLTKEEYPKKKITEIDGILAEIKKKDKEYTDLMAKADKELSSKEYENAITSYTSALKVKPTETKPTEQIEKAKTAIAQLKKLEEDYKNAITKADKDFSDKNYESSIVSYTEAAKLKPEESKPKEQIEKAKSAIAAAKKLEEDYNEAIVAGDKSFSEKDYEKAITSYQEALKLKENETKPKDQIAASIEAIAKIKKLDDDYKLALSDGNKALKAKTFETAITSFQKASRLKPEEKLPKEKIEEAKKEIAAAKKRDEDYTNLMAKADKEFSAKDYSTAITSYKDALKLKPEESKPTQQIDAAKKALADIAKKEKEYKDLLSKANNELGTNKFDEALASFEKASAVKPAEQAPKDGIEKAKTAIAQLKKLEEDYKNAITKADKDFSDKNYESSIVSYTEAAKLKPEESKPKEQIEKAKSAIAAAKKLEEDYNEAIVAGDKSFSEKDYEKAITSYQEALKLKENETKPKDQIAASIEAIAKIKKLDDDYKLALSDGNKALKAKTFETAITSFQKASRLKPEEKLPKEKIEEAKKEIAAAKKRDEDYTNLMAKADKEFSAKDYSTAITSYKDALKLKPEESKPTQQIDAAKKALADIAKKEKEYKDLLSKANNELGTNKFDEALASFEKASAVKPAEQAPKDGIEKAKKGIELAKQAAEEAERLAKEKAEAEAAETEAERKRVAEAEKLAKEKEEKEKEEARLLAEKEQAEKDAAEKARLAKEERDKKDIAEKERLAKEAAANAEAQRLKAEQDKADAKKKADELAQLNKEKAEKDAAEKARLAKEEQDKKDAAEKERLAKEAAANAEAQRLKAEQDKEDAKRKADELAQLNKDKATKEAADKLKREKDEAARKAADADRLAKENAEKERKAKEAAANELAKQEAAKKAADAQALLDKERAAKEAADKAKQNEENARLAKERAERDAADKAKQLADQAEREKEKQRLAKEQADKAAAAQAEMEKNLANKKAEDLKRKEAQRAQELADEKARLDRENARNAQEEKERLAAENAKKEEQDKRNKEQNKRYYSLIKKADQQFEDKAYRSAKSSYNSALGIKPNENHPKNQIQAINTILENMSEQERNTIASTDDYFDVDAEFYGTEVDMSGDDGTFLLTAIEDNSKLREYMDFREYVDSSIKANKKSALRDVDFTQLTYDEYVKISDQITENVGVNDYGRNGSILSINLFLNAYTEDINNTSLDNQKNSLANYQAIERLNDKYTEEYLALQKKENGLNEGYVKFADRNTNFYNKNSLNHLKTNEEIFAELESFKDDISEEYSYKAAEYTQNNEDYVALADKINDNNELIQDKEVLSARNETDYLEKTVDILKEKDEAAAKKVGSQSEEYYEYGDKQTELKQDLSRSENVKITTTNQELNEISDKILDESNKGQQSIEKNNTQYNELNDKLAEKNKELSKTDQESQEKINEYVEKTNDLLVENGRAGQKKTGANTEDYQAYKDKLADLNKEKSAENTASTLSTSQEITDLEEKILEKEKATAKENLNKDRSVNDYTEKLADLNKEKSLENTSKTLSTSEGIDELNDKKAEETSEYTQKANETDQNLNDYQDSQADKKTDEQKEYNEKALEKNKKYDDLEDTKDIQKSEVTKDKLAALFPEGVTQKVYQKKNEYGEITSITTRRVVVVGNKGDDYVHKKSKAGDFYFKNGKSISESTWDLETSGEIVNQ